MSTSANDFVTGPLIEAHLEDGVWWAACDPCRFVVTADTWDDLFRLVGEFHQSEDASHTSWTMLAPAVVV